MLQKLKSITDQNAPNLVYYLYARLVKTMKNTSKADKYARLIANIVKLIRTATQQTKRKYDKVYKQLLVVRQIFRWQGLYQAAIEFNQKGWSMFQVSNVNNLAFIVFEMFGDMLDRAMFVIQLFDLKQYREVYKRLDQMESNCYFIQCLTWFLFHLRTFNKTMKEGTYQQKKVKILKLIKYFIDSLTSYTKFSRRIWQLKPKQAAVLGIFSSIIGIYELLQ